MCQVMFLIPDCYTLGTGPVSYAIWIAMQYGL